MYFSVGGFRLKRFHPRNAKVVQSITFRQQSTGNASCSDQGNTWPIKSRQVTPMIPVWTSLIAMDGHFILASVFFVLHFWMLSFFFDVEPFSGWQESRILRHVVTIWHDWFIKTKRCLNPPPTAAAPTATFLPVLHPFFPSAAGSAGSPSVSWDILPPQCWSPSPCQKLGNVGPPAAGVGVGSAPSTKSSPFLKPTKLPGCLCTTKAVKPSRHLLFCPSPRTSQTRHRRSHNILPWGKLMKNINSGLA